MTSNLNVECKLQWDFFNTIAFVSDIQMIKSFSAWRTSFVQRSSTAYTSTDRNRLTPPNDINRPSGSDAVILAISKSGPETRRLIGRTSGV